MLEYAALDVAHLLPQRPRLKDEIAAAGRTAWAGEEFERLVDNLEPMPEKGASLTRVKGARELSPRQLAVLQALLDWREERAKALDIPTFKVIGTERLVKIAERLPRGRRELDGLKVLSERQAARFGGELSRAVERGMKVPGTELPAFPAHVHQKRDFSAERILKQFKTARDRKAEDLGLDPGFLLPYAALKAIARLKPRDLKELRESGVLKAWQMEAMGDTLLACLHD
jgi:ribonuclease D